MHPERFKAWTPRILIAIGVVCIRGASFGLPEYKWQVIVWGTSRYGYPGLMLGNKGSNFQPIGSGLVLQDLATWLIGFGCMASQTRQHN